MPAGRAVLLGLGAALAVSLPAALLAQIVAALVEGTVPATVTVPLAAVVLTGAAVGGWTAGRQPEATWWTGLLAGAGSLALVAALGVARRVVADGDVQALAIPLAFVLGAGLGGVGSALGTRAAARTRP